MQRPFFLPCDEADSVGPQGKDPKNSQMGGLSHLSNLA